MLQQKPNHILFILLSSHIKGSEAELRLGIDGTAMFYQQFNHVNLTAERGNVQSGISFLQQETGELDSRLTMLASIGQFGMGTRTTEEDIMAKRHVKPIGSIEGDCHDSSVGE